jgi:peptidoglycan hydrolase-like protein with peptidoglycan-binding domain
VDGNYRLNPADGNTATNMVRVWEVDPSTQEVTYHRRAHGQYNSRSDRLYGEREAVGFIDLDQMPNAGLAADRIAALNAEGNPFQPVTIGSGYHTRSRNEYTSQFREALRSVDPSLLTATLALTARNTVSPSELTADMEMVRSSYIDRNTWRDIQQTLKDEGLYHGAIDGLPHRRDGRRSGTEQALMDFANNNGLPMLINGRAVHPQLSAIVDNPQSYLQAIAAASASAPDSSAPDSSAPDSSAPDSSAPDSSAPDQSIEVRKGDGLIRISNRIRREHGVNVDWRDLARMNGLDPDDHTIHPGQTLRFTDNTPDSSTPGAASSDDVGDMPIELTGTAYSEAYDALHSRVSQGSVRYLQSGNRGADVEGAQRMLRNFGYDVEVSKNYDTSTIDAVRKFQRDNGLKTDGLLGRQTFAAMELREVELTIQQARESGVQADGINMVSAQLQQAASALEGAGRMNESFKEDIRAASDGIQAFLQENNGSEPDAATTSANQALDRINKVVR